jgi:Viral BACON domain
MNDLLPEEQDPQFEELIMLLRQADLNPQIIDLSTHEQIISQARARLFHTEPEGSTYEDLPTSKMSGLGSIPSKSKGRRDKQIGSGRLTHLLNVLAAVLVVAVLIGFSLLIFGPWSTLQRGRAGTTQSIGPVGTTVKISVFTLLVTPSNAAIGGIITLHGTAFSPNGRVGLTRDASITLFDTHGMDIIHADSQGTFTDSAIVDPYWGPGAHVIHAEDAKLHKSASFTVFVTGQGISLRTSHLLFSPNAIDLGLGDQATNTTQTVTLTNTGGEQITWQATVTQPWLLVSPKSGILASKQKMNVEVAADRSTLKVGTYTTGLVFVSNTGQATLPVKMIVTQLQPGHNAILQLDPAVLSFAGTDEAANRRLN